MKYTAEPSEKSTVKITLTFDKGEWDKGGTPESVNAPAENIITKAQSTPKSFLHFIYANSSEDDLSYTVSFYSQSGVLSIIWVQ